MPSIVIDGKTFHKENCYTKEFQEESPVNYNNRILHTTIGCIEFPVYKKSIQEGLRSQLSESTIVRDLRVVFQGDRVLSLQFVQGLDMGVHPSLGADVHSIHALIERKIKEFIQERQLKKSEEMKSKQGAFSEFEAKPKDKPPLFQGLDPMGAQATQVKNDTGGSAGSDAGKNIRRKI